MYMHLYMYKPVYIYVNTLYNFWLQSIYVYTYYYLYNIYVSKV